ncbi:adenylosuccinate synthetase [Bradyrhizobium sp. NBAIM02]|nr:adenylosuccinate synthetase [Bradyrhizobium sp. NBAIM02]
MAQRLSERYNARIIKTRDLIRAYSPQVKEERAALQRAGERLDRADGGAWVKNALVRFIEQHDTGSTATGFFVLDSARIPGQVRAVREAYGTAVHHIHLDASDGVLAERYSNRTTRTKEFEKYEDVRRSKTERDVRKLANLADTVVATDRCTPDAVLVRAIALLGLYPRHPTPLVDVLVGGQYGSEGKGNIVGHIAHEYSLLVRVGGPNAGHKVYAEPEPEAYFHLPSGTERAPKAQLLLGAGAVIFPPKLLQEIATHQLDAERLSIDPQAMIIEDADIVHERNILESISSTAQGVGAAAARKIMGRGGKANPKVRLASEVPELKPFIRDGQAILERTFARGERVLLEGTQGTSLSLHHGFYPWVTSRDTGVAGCLADAGIATTRVRRVVMVCRTYPIRVGGPSGHMQLEISYEELAERSGIDITELKKTETTTTTKKQRRLGEFDWEQLHRSTMLNGPTDIALTFVDYLNKNNRDAYRFDQLTLETVRFIEEVERVSGVPVSLISTNFSWRNVIDRRSW